MNLSVPKKTGTYADTLHAVGLADLVRELCKEVPEIVDKGSEFQITIQEWTPGKWSAPLPGYPYVWDSKKETKPPSGEVLDYRKEVEKRDSMREVSKQKIKDKAPKQIKSRMQEQGMDLPENPKPELGLVAILASMRKGWEGDRQLYRWLTEDRARALAWTKHKLNLDGCVVKDPKWSNTQFLNPVTGKGVHSPKTVARAPNAINPELSDPFEDWLKLRGSFDAMLAYREADDFKLFVVEPAQATPTVIKDLVNELRMLNLWGGVRLDIHAVLRCTAELVRHSDVMPQGSIPLRGRTPRKIIAGLRQAYFKSLGTAAALMNNALFPLPDWFAIDTADDGYAMLDIINELIGSNDQSGCLASLQESHSDECAILQQCRNWLGSGTLHDFLLFQASFAVHLMQRRTHREWARPFSTHNLTFLLSKGYDMNKIVTNPGFLSVARAIRNATIYSVGDNAPVQVSTRFGLAQQWKQKLRSGKAEFIAGVADFIQQYNWEVINRFKRKYHVVDTTDLDQLTQLMEEYDAEIVGLLLLAYGYAQGPKTEARVSTQGVN
jgi:hypothetical protein